MKEITEKTVIPISMLAGFAGVVFWITTVYSDVKAMAVEKQKFEIKIDLVLEKLNTLDRRLTIIETKIGAIK